MTSRYHIDLDHDDVPWHPDPPSSPGAVIKMPSPTNPGVRALRNQALRRQQTSSSSPSDHTPPQPFIPRVKQPGNPNHPAHARAASSRSSAPSPPPPSLVQAQSELPKLVCLAVGTTITHAEAKASRTSVANIGRPKAGISKPARVKPSSVKRRRTDEELDPMADAHKPSHAGVARSKSQTVPYLKSRISEPEYDFPSSTPTPPPKQRPPPFGDPSSSSSSSDMSSYSLSLSGLGHQSLDGARSRFAAFDPAPVVEDISMAESESSPRASSSSFDPPPRAIPRSRPDPSMPPPPVPKRCVHSLSEPAPAPAPTPSLSRPFQAPGPTQADRPRSSQHPPPLGMLRRRGQSGQFLTNTKPFKVPFANKPAQRADTITEGGGGRSLSPIIPDPPHIVARAQAAAEMTARRPEPMDEDEDEDEEGQDANSSADLWASFAPLDDIGDIP